MNVTTTVIGLVAGVLTNIAFLAQVIKTWKTRETKDLSLWTFILQAGGSTLWVIHGINLKQIPLILWNAFTLILVLIIIRFKVRYK